MQKHAAWQRGRLLIDTNSPDTNANLPVGVPRSDILMLAHSATRKSTAELFLADARVVDIVDTAIINAMS